MTLVWFYIVLLKVSRVLVAAFFPDWPESGGYSPYLLD